jgi:type IV pilus assembly protein PilM
MAGAIWGIDIGKAALKAVKLRATKEGLEIKAVEHIDYEGSSTEEEKRAEQVREALKSFLSKHKVKNDRVLVALPGLHAFSRFIKLPPVDAKKVGMMVRMEAQQQIPFPIAEVNWDFQKIEREYEPGEEIEVGIFATQRERITGFLSELQAQNLEPGIVTIAPLAIYNFMAYNVEPTDEAVVVLDIGSDHTDLVVINGPRFWIRNLRIAGNDITKALAERFKVSFEEAEKLKRNASKSEQSKKIFSSMEPTLKDLVGEVHRSVGFFKSQAPGGELKITKMILLGDGAKLKNLPPFFEKELGYPVEKVAKLEQDKFVLDPDVDVEMLKKHLLGFGVALGLAIQGAGKAKCAINLAPENIKVNEELRRKAPWAMAAAGVAWATFGLSFVLWSGWKDHLSDTIKKANKTLTPYNGVKQAAENADKAGKALLAKADPLKDLVANRTLPLDVLRQIQKALNAVCKQNGDIPPLGKPDETLDHQKDSIDKGRNDKGSDNHLWVLDFGVEKKVDPAGFDPTKGKATPDGVFTVSIKLARPMSAAQIGQAVRDQMIGEFVTPLLAALKDAPFYVKDPDKPNTEATAYFKNNGDLAKTVVTAGGDLDQLDPNSPQAQYPKKLHCWVVDVKFDVGFAPPPAAPAADAPAKGGN